VSRDTPPAPPEGESEQQDRRPQLWGIGVGPGDPELITVKGLRLLQAAEVVFLPVRRAGAHSYAGQIVAEYLAPARQEIVPLVYPARRDTAAPERQWARNADQIADYLAPDRLGVFLTEGDPLLYSTFVHALLPLRARHPQVRVGVLPGLYSLADLRGVLERFDTVVLLKPGRDLAALQAAIAECDASMVWVRRVGRPEQAIIRDRAALPATRPDYFSLLIVRRRRAGPGGDDRL
jgi:precorrin-2/cobalt-factor-2 C20-methyltransferase